MIARLLGRVTDRRFFSLHIGIYPVPAQTVRVQCSVIVNARWLAELGFRHT